MPRPTDSVQSKDLLDLPSVYLSSDLVAIRFRNRYGLFGVLLWTLPLVNRSRGDEAMGQDRGTTELAP